MHALPHRIDARRRSDRSDHRAIRTGLKNLELLDDLCELMLDGSLCALGGLTPIPVLSAVQPLSGGFRQTGATPPHMPGSKETRHGVNTGN